MPVQLTMHLLLHHNTFRTQSKPASHTQQPLKQSTTNQRIILTISKPPNSHCHAEHSSAHQRKILSLNTNLNPLTPTIPNIPRTHRRPIPILPSKRQIDLLPVAAIILDLRILSIREGVLSRAAFVCWPAGGLGAGGVFIKADCAGAEGAGDGEEGEEGSGGFHGEWVELSLVEKTEAREMVFD